MKMINQNKTENQKTKRSRVVEVEMVVVVVVVVEEVVVVVVVVVVIENR